MANTIVLICLVILALLVCMLLFKCIAGIFKAISDQINGYRSQAWPGTTGQIIFADVKHVSDGEGNDLYRPEVRYRYQVNGKQYHNRRITFKLQNPLENMFGRDRRRAAEIVKQYAIGREVTVYYQPNRPKRATLEPGHSSISLLLLQVGFLAGIVFLILLVFAWPGSPIASFFYEFIDYLGTLVGLNL
jgi:hypothetical protein